MEETSLVFSIIWDVLKNWWWAILPFLLLRPFLFLWQWWRRELWVKKQKFILLEIKLPKEVLKPIRAMEQVFSALWGNLYDPPDWWENWIEGKVLLSYSLDIVSFGGEVHFFIRIPEPNRNAVESSIYSQYPDAEISVRDDYTKYVPQDIPNKEWDLWGTDYKLAKEDVYPIKTYSKFFEERPEVAKEEKRIDPLASLLEGLSRLSEGEQLWIQILAQPISTTEDNYVERGRRIADKLAKRPEKPKTKPLFLEAAQVLVTGKPPGVEEKKEEPLIPPEMKLTPGEKEILSAVEGKIGKQMFKCAIRFIYLGKRDRFFKPQIRTPMGFFQQFATSNLNTLRPWGQPLITKVPKHWFLPLNLLIPRRLYVRKRRLFRNYVRRFPPLFPRRPDGTFLLDIEELATIFHPPGAIVAPAPFVPRVESKKGEAPPGLPME
jgi:hypothetical protein